MDHKRTFFLVDFENVHSSFSRIVSGDTAHVLVFVGAKQAKIDFETADLLQKMGNRAQYIKIGSSGKNSLDFCIAYYMGKLSSEYSGAEFQIVSNDTGYDPLIAHLKHAGIKCARVSPPVTVPAPKSAPKPKPADDSDIRLSAIKRGLDQCMAATPPCCPASTKSLSAFINARFQNKLSESEVQSLVSALTARKIIVITGEKVTYRKALNGKGRSPETLGVPQADGLMQRSLQCERIMHVRGDREIATGPAHGNGAIPEHAANDPLMEKDAFDLRDRNLGDSA
ncbi:PIN domain-containing protein [Acetobacter malorum]|uniref:PIN domain-containing protein n=1 Tax=Acetobacter malorum TaxID=178901 RepID=UPI0018D4A5CA|nr:PIN domain-containing protein [Acetobacter malorum]